MTICADCQAILNPTAATTIIDVATGTPVYRCAPCFRSHLRRTSSDIERRRRSGLLATVDDAADEHRLGQDAIYRFRVARERQERIEAALR